MVGRLLCKCLNLRSFCKSVLVLLAISPTTTHAAGGATATIGTARTEPTITAPVLMEVTPDAVSFVDVPVGETYTQTVRITNISEGTLQIKGITASDLITAPVLMEVTPDAVSFVDVPVGETYTQTVRITNISEGTLQIKGITA